MGSHRAHPPVRGLQVSAKALSRLMKELNEGTDDPVSYSGEEVYRMLEVEPKCQVSPSVENSM